MKRLYTIVVALLFTCYLHAQNNPGTANINFVKEDVGFNLEGKDTYITSFAVRADSNIVAAGRLSIYNGIAREAVVLLNHNGVPRQWFYTGFGANGKIWSVVLQPDNKIIVTGDFTLYDSLNYAHIVRLNPDGHIDTTFNCTGSNGLIYISCIQPDNKILVGGDFTMFNGLARRSIVRLNTDGTLDTTFNANITVDSWVKTILIQPDNKIVMAGSNLYEDDAYTVAIERLHINGNRDTTFECNLHGQVNEIKIFPDNKIVVCGTLVYNNTQHELGLMDANGVFVPGFNADYLFNGNGYHNIALGVAVTTDNNILVVGSFGYTVNSSTTQHIAKISTTGSLITPFCANANYITYEDYQQNISDELNRGTIYQYPSGDILISGYFKGFMENSTVLRYVYTNNIIKIKSTGVLDNSFSTLNGFNITKLVPGGDNKIYLSWGRRYLNTFPKQPICLDPLGNIIDLLPSNNSGASQINSPNIYSELYGLYYNGSGCTVNTLPNNRLMLGTLTKYNNTTITNNTCIVNSNWNYDPSFTLTRLDYADRMSTYLDAVQRSDGKYVLAGLFDSPDGQSDYIVCLNSNGTEDTSWPTTGFNSGTTAFGYVNDLELLPDDKVLACGRFRNYRGFPSSGIARIKTNGRVDSTFTSHFFSNDYTVRKILVLPNGQYLAVGYFDIYSGRTVNGIVRLYNDGTLDTTFMSGTGAYLNQQNQWYLTPFKATIADACLQPDGKIIIVGEFDEFDGHEVYNIARLNEDGSFDTTFVTGRGLQLHEYVDYNNSYGLSVEMFNGNILVSGHFDSYNGVGKNNLVLINNSIIITNNPSGAQFCGGGTINIPYTAYGTFNQGNIFSLELSDSSGSFTNPVVIGFIADTTSGTIAGIIPDTTPTGMHYKLRVNSSSPYIIGKENTAYIAILEAPEQPLPISIFTTNVCQGDSNIIFALQGNDSLIYQWTYSGTGAAITNNNNNDSVYVDFSTTATSGIIAVSVTDGCGYSAPQELGVTVFNLPGLTLLNAVDTVYIGQNNILYSVGLDTTCAYTWLYNGNGVIITPDENNASISFGDNATSGILTVIAENSCGADTLTIDITVLDPVNVSQQLYSGVRVLNNYSTIIIETKENMLLSLFDMKGRKVIADKQVTPGPNAIEVGALSTGVYLLRLQNGNKAYNQKIVLGINN
jgi:uncharacterized delta-60 repeat protein